MLNKINMSPTVRYELQGYLKEHALTLQEAMEVQESNEKIAEIFYSGLPAMLKMAYPLKKMQTFFWEKRALLITYLSEKMAKPTPNPAKKINKSKKNK